MTIQNEIILPAIERPKSLPRGYISFLGLHTWYMEKTTNRNSNRRRETQKLTWKKCGIAVDEISAWNKNKKRASV